MKWNGLILLILSSLEVNVYNKRSITVLCIFLVPDHSRCVWASFPARTGFGIYRSIISMIHMTVTATVNNEKLLSSGLKKINYFRKYHFSFFKVFNFCIVNY